MPWKKISLRTRIYLMLTSLVLVTVAGGLVMVWYTYRIEQLTTALIGRHFLAFEAASNLAFDLATQKGFVSYYFIDGNEAWLEDLARHRRTFQDQMEKARLLADTKEERLIMADIESQYIRYVSSMDRVIDYYKSGKRDLGRQLHETLRPLFFKILDLCSEFKSFQKKGIQRARTKAYREAARLRFLAAGAVVLVIVLGALLLFLLIHHILEPVRRLASETAGREGLSPRDEVSALSHGVHGLKEQYDRAAMELERSKEQLLQAEKLALVARLGAGTAHSIRNPLTSVKMRLFSLSRTLDLNADQQEDFDVISQEIGHIDNIVQNFLEFARPPRLKLQPVSLSDVVDQAALLMGHRLESCHAQLVIIRQESLPEVHADPEQLKEALVNILNNACEATEPEGRIEIKEQLQMEQEGRAVAVIRISDTGSGIPDEIKDKIFEPFFTTKEEGSGLGLSIVARIIEQHGGTIEAESREGKGACFVIKLPVGRTEGA